VKVVIGNFENETLDESQVQRLLPETQEIVSIILNAGHFAVVQVDIGGKMVKVMEGQGGQRRIPHWANHMSRMLIRNSLVPFGTAAGHFGKFKGQHVKLGLGLGRQRFLSQEAMGVFSVAFGTLC
jgi:hypothetical protein